MTPNTYLIIFPDGQRFEFEYEEMVELVAAGRNSTQGNEYLDSMKVKADKLFKSLPVSDY